MITSCKALLGHSTHVGFDSERSGKPLVGSGESSPTF